MFQLFTTKSEWIDSFRTNPGRGRSRRKYILEIMEQ